VFCIFSRGMLRQIYTRLYFSDEASNANDPILTLVPADRRGTLVAHKEMRGDMPVYRFDIRVQGENETGFLRHLTERHRFSAVSGHLSVADGPPITAQRLGPQCGNSPRSGLILACGWPEFRF
jgi:hypothetical protein